MEVYPLNIRYKPGYEFVVSYGTIDRVKNVVVKIVAEDGTEGHGEATPIPMFNGETQDSALGILAVYTPFLLGEEASNIARIHEKMDSLPGNNTAKAAVDMALYDLVGRAAGLPVYKLLGGAFLYEAPLHYSIGIKNPNEMAEEARKRVEEGFRTLEVKVGRYKSRVSIEDDVARVKAIRDAVGNDITLIVDSNIGWSIREAVAAIRRIEGLDVMVEQPVRGIQGLKEVKNRVSAPIIADESCQGVEDTTNIIRTEAADIISMKLTKVGGFHKAEKILAMCEAFGLGYRYDNQIQTRLASTASLHLNMAHAHGIPSGGTQFLRQAEDLVAEGGLMVEKGVSRLANPDAPGLGATIRKELLGTPTVYQ